MWGSGKILDGRDFKFFRFVIGSSHGVYFWHDLWRSGEKALKHIFLMLYQISSDKEVVIADLLLFSNGSIHWNVSFFRAAQDWELDLFAIFLVLFMLCRLVLRWWID